MILVVDDNALAAEMTRLLLLASNRPAACATGFAEAERSLAEGGYRCVVADHLMPGTGGTGLDLVRRLRARGDRTPALLVTGLSGEHAEAIQAAIDGEKLSPCWLRQKPVEPAELIRMVDALCEGASTERYV